MKPTITIEPVDELPPDPVRQFNSGYQWTLKGDGIGQPIVSHAASVEIALETAKSAALDHGVAKPRVVNKTGGS